MALMCFNSLAAFDEKWIFLNVEWSMENMIYSRLRAVDVSRFLRASKQLVCNLIALPSTAGDSMRVWAQKKIEWLSTRKWHPGTFPVAMLIGMGLLWAQLHGYLHVPITMCDWSRFLGW